MAEGAAGKVVRLSSNRATSVPAKLREIADFLDSGEETYNEVVVVLGGGTAKDLPAEKECCRWYSNNLARKDVLWLALFCADSVRGQVVDD